jgi:hypothetical protein
LPEHLDARIRRVGIVASKDPEFFRALPGCKQSAKSKDKREMNDFFMRFSRRLQITDL